MQHGAHEVVGCKGCNRQMQPTASLFKISLAAGTMQRATCKVGRAGVQQTTCGGGAAREPTLRDQVKQREAEDDNKVWSARLSHLCPNNTNQTSARTSHPRLRVVCRGRTAATIDVASRIRFENSPPLHRHGTYPRHIRTGTGLTPTHNLTGTGLAPAHICIGTDAPLIGALVRVLGDKLVDQVPLGPHDLCTRGG